MFVKLAGTLVGFLKVHFLAWCWPLVICLRRLVGGLPAGLGSVPQAGRPQHADELHGVVAVRDRRPPGRHHRRAGVGGAVCRLSAGGRRLHGEGLRLSCSPAFLSMALVSSFQSLRILFVPTAVSDRLLRGCQCSSWERPGRRVHGAGQAVLQGLPPQCMYESVTCLPVHQPTLQFPLHSVFL